ncbi:MAG: hypothetical protein OXF02_05740 [Simkaniaceae bacterium]|nr:hypothetical protein [Simkaniaceae bacterium]
MSSLNRLFLVSFFFVLPLFPGERIDPIYYGLDPSSLFEQLTFHKLYPRTEKGQQALARAWELINRHRTSKNAVDPALTGSDININHLVLFANKEVSSPPATLNREEIRIIERISDHLHNRKLKGHTARTVEEVLALPDEEIDLARALLIHTFEEDPERDHKMAQYEAGLDFMALQVLGYLPIEMTDEEKITAINRLIFYEKQFRYPAEMDTGREGDIDVYSLLPSVLDKREGVCLGTSVLYLAIAQRIGLPLEIVTPPGHIYLRYVAGEETINIETTDRGVSVPSEYHLNMSTSLLQTRSMKEVIGLSFVNQAASASLRHDDALAALFAEKGSIYLRSDPSYPALAGEYHLLAGNTERGTALLKEVDMTIPEHRTCQTGLQMAAEDYLMGHVDAEGLRYVLTKPEERGYEILLTQAEKLETYLHKQPRFRLGLLELAAIYLELHKEEKATEALLAYHARDRENPHVEYLLAMTLCERFRFQEAWYHLNNAERITDRKGYRPKPLIRLKRHLHEIYPINP